MAALAVAVAWITIWFRFREPQVEAASAPPDLKAWDYLGCLELAVGRWGGAAGDSAGPSAGPRLPRVLMLLPDAFDGWGRAFSTYRALPLDPPAGSPESVPYRWFTRADTLWLVWSDRDARGGIALREAGSSLSGRAALARRSVSGTLDAQVSAWPVNCYTGARETTARGRLR